MSDEARGSPTLTDGVVVLRAMTLDDADTHLRGEDEDSVRWLTDGRRSTIATTRSWIERNLTSWRELGPTRTFGIRDARTDELVGMVEANLDTGITKLAPGEVNVSYQVYPHARGRGYARRAVVMLCRYLGSTGGADVAVIRVDPGNAPSRRVAVGAGFVSTGITTTSDGDELERLVRRLEPRVRA